MWLVRTGLAIAFLGRTWGQDFSTLERTAAAELEKLHIPGASIAIVRGDRLVYSKGIGKASVETGETVNPEMLFRLGSTTKMFTAAALTGLAVEGKIELNAPIGKYLAGLPSKLADVTASQLLSHTAGLRDDGEKYGLHDDAALGNGIRAATDQWLFAEPGKIFSYANPGYWIAGHLVELLTGRPYADAMEFRVFQPLGMSRTTLRPTMAMTYPLAPGHEYADGKLKIRRPAADNAATWPSGSIFSNTGDLSRFVIAFMNEGRVDGKQALDPKTIALMSTPRAVNPGAGHSYGYGLRIADLRGVHLMLHGGNTIGYGSHIVMAPRERIAFIVQTNLTGGTLPDTEEKALEMLLPMGPKENAQKSRMVTTADDIARVAGSYRNGSQRIDITARGSQLYLKRGQGGEAQLYKYSDTEYRTENPPDRFTILAGSDGKTEFVQRGSRAFVRVP